MLGEILEKLAREIGSENAVKVRVGRVSEEVVEEMMRNKKEHKAEHEAIKVKIDEFIKEVAKNHNCEKFQNQKNEIWEKVYNELGLTEEERGYEYQLNKVERIVYRIEEGPTDTE